MASNKITGGKPGPGRPKGSPNKVSKAAKDAIAEAAEKLGGVNRLVAWAKEDTKNESMFWTTIYPKLIPIQLAGDADAPLVTEIVIRGVAANSRGA
jgi:hypothetical protein